MMPDGKSVLYVFISEGFEQTWKVPRDGTLGRDAMISRNFK